MSCHARVRVISLVWCLFGVWLVWFGWLVWFVWRLVGLVGLVWLVWFGWFGWFGLALVGLIWPRHVRESELTARRCVCLLCVVECRVSLVFYRERGVCVLVFRRNRWWTLLRTRHA